MARLGASLFALLALFTSCVLRTYAVTPLEVKGADFVNSADGKRFQLIGVAYQPGGSSGYNPGSDALSDSSVCLRDAVLLQRLGVNAIRVYNLDPEVDHTECASIFNAAGIYMLLDVNSPLPNESLNRGAPWESYNKGYLERTFKVVEAFKNFPNTLGFFSGNEVINEDSVPEVPAYVRAVTRDIKDYIAKNSKRPIAVGYSAADVRPLLAGTFNYMSCNVENDTQSKIDFFGLNSYSWCGDATYQTSGYDVLVEDFSNTTIPIFFSEYGCNEVTPRTFTEVGALYSMPMMGVFSGGMIYEYSQEPNNYGLVEVGDGGDVDILGDYNNLMKQYNKLDVKAIQAANSTATNLDAPTCDADLLSGANFTSSFDIPARVDGIDDLINNGVPGKWPSGTTKVTDTQPKQTVTDNGQTMTGLKLNVLADDESNLPGENTSGASPTGTSSGSSPTSSDSAVRIDGHQFGTLTIGALALGLFVQL